MPSTYWMVMGSWVIAGNTALYLWARWSKRKRTRELYEKRLSE